MKTYSSAPAPDETKQKIPCPVCGGRHFRKHWNCENYHFVRCNACGLILQNPQPEFAAIAERYDDHYFRYEIENEEIFFDLMRKGLEDVDFFRQFPPDKAFYGKFLDIGCATGILIERLRPQWETSGVELCEPAARYGREKRIVDIHTGTVEQAHFHDASFDVVHCSHLIEHLNRPDLFLQEVARILKPDGLFIAVTPNTSGFQARRFKARWRSAIADHLCLFSPSNLSWLVKSVGLKPERIKTWGGLGKGYGPPWLKKWADPLAKKMGKGDVMIMKARKKS